MPTKTAAPKPKDIFLIGEIDTDSTKEFMIKLRDLHEKLPIRIPIRIVLSCEGGDMELSLGMISTIENYKRGGRRIITHVAGYAYSAAAILLQVGDHRTIDRISYIMTHKPWVEMEEGWKPSADQLHEYTLQIDRLGTIQVKYFANRSGFPSETLRDIFFVDKADRYFDAEVALSYNLVDEIID